MLVEPWLAFRMSEHNANHSVITAAICYYNLFNLIIFIIYYCCCCFNFSFTHVKSLIPKTIFINFLLALCCGYSVCYKIIFFMLLLLLLCYAFMRDIQLMYTLKPLMCIWFYVCSIIIIIITSTLTWHFTRFCKCYC